MNMATDCCCIPSINEVLCIHLLVYDELRLYATCKVNHAEHHERREWWQHVKQFGGLVVSHHSWNGFLELLYCMA